MIMLSTIEGTDSNTIATQQKLYSLKVIFKSKCIPETLEELIGKIQRIHGTSLSIHGTYCYQHSKAKRLTSAILEIKTYYPKEVIELLTSKHLNGHLQIEKFSRFIIPRKGPGKFFKEVSLYTFILSLFAFLTFVFSLSSYRKRESEFASFAGASSFKYVTLISFDLMPLFSISLIAYISGTFLYMRSANVEFESNVIFYGILIAVVLSFIYFSTFMINYLKKRRGYNE